MSAFFSWLLGAIFSVKLIKFVSFSDIGFKINQVQYWNRHFSLFEKTKRILYFGTFQIDLKRVSTIMEGRRVFVCVSLATHRDSGVSIFL